MKTPDPIARLIKEHEEALHNLQVLNKTTDEFIQHGFSEERFERFLASVRYIEEEVQVHNLKEEQVLFPALEKHVNGPTRSLRKDHKELAETSKELQESIKKVRENPYDQRAITELVALGKEAVRIFVNHIRKENDILFPIARKVLKKEELREIAKILTEES